MVDRMGWVCFLGVVVCTYRVLVGVETAVVEAAIGTAEAQCVGRSIAIVSPGIGEIDVIRAEVLVAKGRIIRHRVARRTRARQTGIESGRDNKDTRVHVVHALAGAVLVRSRPGDGHLVLGSVRRSIRLTEQGDWTRTGDIHLLLVCTSQDEDGLGRSVIWQGLNGSLDGGEVCFLVRGRDLDSTLWTVIARCLALLAGDVIEGYTVDAGCVPQEREESCNVEAKHGGPTSCYGWDPLAEDTPPGEKDMVLLYLLQGIAPHQWCGKCQ